MEKLKTIKLLQLFNGTVTLYASRDQLENGELYTAKGLMGISLQCAI